MCADWGYTKENGPETWAEKFPDASGPRQSPVDIVTSLATSDTNLTNDSLFWNYPNDICIKISNTGYGWKIDTTGIGTKLSGGPLDSVYELAQFHCHWGSSSDEGSEHTVDGKPFAAELHLVHWNSGKYDSIESAAAQPDGLAVLGIFLQAGDDEHSEIKKVVNMLPSIIFKGQSSKIIDQMDLNLCLPSDKSYWTYLGSLTTPPCSECVTWIVFKEPITVTEDQLEIFRNLRTISEDQNFNEDTLLRYNYRPPLPLGNRVLRECGSI